MRLFAVAPVLGLATASSNSSVKKVIDLLDGMKGKVESELESGKAEAEEYSDWCIKTITETEADVKYGSEKVEELAAAAEKGDSLSAAKAAEAEELAAAIGKAQSAQKKADAERKEQNKAFLAEEAELVEADTMLGKAHGVLKRALSFAQTDGSQSPEVEKTEEVVAALGAIIDSAWVSQQDSSHIRSFLQEGQPQAQVSNYQSKSGGILDAIQGMQDKNAEVLSKLREKEMKGRHAFEMVMQDLKNKEESKGDQMSAAKEAGAKAAAEAKEAASKGADAEETLAADKTELAETKSGCESYAKEWSSREAEGTEEISVIGQAVDILSGKFGRNDAEADAAAPAFLQVSDKEMEYNKRSQVAGLLRRLSRKFNQYGLVQLAQAANEDPFVKVRGMITDMIAKLEEEARKEASKEAKCKADKAKGAKDLKVKRNDFDKLLARSDASEAKFAKLGSEIADLGAQLSELEESVREATNMRNKQATDNAAVVKDAAESIEALNGAISVLSDFYGAEAPTFIQVSAKKEGDTAAVILEILQTAQEDFEKLKQETEAAESKAKDKYEKDMQAAEVSKAKKTAQKEGKQNQKATVKSQIAQISEDLGDSEKALQAAQDFLKGVMEACANKAMSYEERQAKRAAEIAGLKEALEILSPDAEFLQTGKFLEKRN
jgi:hypothetical protein